jgi:hypothetical protein
MVFRVDILVRDPELVFDWTSRNTDAEIVVRQIAKGVDYEALKAGALIATCPAESANHGWLVKTVVKDRATAERMVSTWQPLAAR